MSNTKYQFAKETDKIRWSAPDVLGDEITKVRRLASNIGGPYRIRERTDNKPKWSVSRPLGETVTQLRGRLSHADVGTLFSIECEGRILATQRTHILVRKVRIHTQADKIPPIPQCTPAIADVWRAVYGRFGNAIINWGICNCRKIAGSSSWSQHSWCNAWDIHGSNTTMNSVNRFLNQNKGKLNIANILWQVPDHFDHVHVDCLPTRTGTPPCA